jgi:hypothetical protein
VIVVEFAVRWLAMLSLVVWLGSLVYLIIAAVILFRHAGAAAGDLIGRLLAAMSIISYICMIAPAAWAIWAVADGGNWLSWSRLVLYAATVALALVPGLWELPTAAAERRRRNEHRGPGPNPHVERFEKLHSRAVRFESAVAVGLGLLTAVETLAVMGVA